jgi:hypothetical protein
MDSNLRMMEINPGDRGFESWFTPPGATVAYRHKLPGGWGFELVTDAAIENIRSAGDEPWLMLMAYIIHHLPDGELQLYDIWKGPCERYDLSEA